MNNRNDVDDNFNAWFFLAMTPVARVFDLNEYSMWRLAIQKRGKKKLSFIEQIV